MPAVESPKAVTGAEVEGWRHSCVHPEDGSRMTQAEAATYLGIGLRTYQRYEEAGHFGWLARVVRRGDVPPGLVRRA